MTTVLRLLAGILVVRFLLVALVAASGGASPGRPRPASPGWMRALVLCLLFSVFAGSFVAAGPRTLSTTVPLGIFIGMVVVWPLARYVLAPLGLVRAAYYVGLVSWRSTDDRVGTALLAASIALHRKRDFDPEEAAWLEEKIQAETPLRPGVIAAAASVAAARGDRDGARALFESVRKLDASLCNEPTRHAVAEWLAADAAARGDWEQVVAVGEQAGAGRAASLLANAGKRLLGKPDAPGRPALLWSWLLAPRRRHTFALVERALSVPDGAVPLPDDEDDGDRAPAPDGDLLAKALAAHVHLLSMKKPTPADVVYVGRAFDAAFDDGRLPAELDERAEQLGAMRAASALAGFREAVEESLFQLLRAHRIALDDTVLELGDMAASAQRRLRDETLTVIEALSDTVRNRVNEKRALPAIDEWRELSALRTAYERGIELGGPELRYLAFTKVHSDVCALGVWLFNDRKERMIGNAMFRFLLAEAEAVGDTAAIELQTKNVACGA